MWKIGYMKRISAWGFQTAKQIYSLRLSLRGRNKSACCLKRSILVRLLLKITLINNA